MPIATKQSPGILVLLRYLVQPNWSSVDDVGGACPRSMALLCARCETHCQDPVCEFHCELEEVTDPSWMLESNFAS